MPLSIAEARTDSLAKFAEQGADHINCAQAVLRFSLLLTGEDTDWVALARQFGGGVAGTGATCGAVTGAALALGLLDHVRSETADAAVTRTRLQEVLKEFAAEFGSVHCRDLTGFDLTTTEGHEAFVQSGGNELCQGYVAWMCDRLAPLLDSMR